MRELSVMMLFAPGWTLCVQSVAKMSGTSALPAQVLRRVDTRVLLLLWTGLSGGRGELPVLGTRDRPRLPSPSQLSSLECPSHTCSLPITPGNVHGVMNRSVEKHPESKKRKETSTTGLLYPSPL